MGWDFGTEAFLIIGVEYRGFTTEMMKNFNRENPDVEGVYYQSYAFVMHSPFSDMFLFVPSLILWCIEGPNDGLLTPDAVRWGNFKGIYKSNVRRGIHHYNNGQSPHYHPNVKNSQRITSKEPCSHDHYIYPQ